MRTRCAGDVLDHPLWKVPNTSLSLFSLGLSLSLTRKVAPGQDGPGV